MHIKSSKEANLNKQAKQVIQASKPSKQTIQASNPSMQTKQAKPANKSSKLDLTGIYIYMSLALSFFLRKGIVTLETKEVLSVALVRICAAQFFAGRSALLIVHYYEALRYGGRLCSNRRSNALAVCRVSKASTSSCSSESKS